MLSLPPGLTYGLQSQMPQRSEKLQGESGDGTHGGLCSLSLPNPAQNVSIPSWACVQVGIPSPHFCQRAHSEHRTGCCLPGSPP